MFQTGMLKYFISNRKNISVLFKKEKICLRFSNYSGNIYIFIKKITYLLLEFNKQVFYRFYANNCFYVNRDIVKPRKSNKENFEKIG